VSGASPPEDLAVGRDWYEQGVVRTYLRDVIPVAECLSLCCGFGEIERLLARQRVFERCTGVDLSPDAIARARAQARQEGHDNIEYVVGDLNTLELDAERYDVVWSNGALHHISGLEHLLAQVKKALKPGGYLIANEYVGPDHQQLSPRQLEIINAVIHLIPREYRLRTEETFVPPAVQRRPWARWIFRLGTGEPTTYQRTWSPMKKLVFPPYALAQRALRGMRRGRGRRFAFGKVFDNDPFYFVDKDPSEGVRASQILPLIEKTFDAVEVRHYHGSVLRYALDTRFFERYDAGSARDRELLEFLLGLEEAMIRLGEVRSENAHIVARKW
jgi:SAM-dependent methyltransferase